MSKFKNWCITINKGITYPYDLNLELLKGLKGLQYIVFQIEEAPTTKRHHLQGYLEFKHGMPLQTLKNKLAKVNQEWYSSHLEPAKGTGEQNEDYCSKEESRIAGPWSWGEKKSPGKRSDLLALRDAVVSGVSPLNIYLSDTLAPVVAKYGRYEERLRTLLYYERANRWLPNDVHVILGPAGTGKTRHIYDTYGHHNVYCLTQSQKETWFDGYEDQPVLLIDDFYGWIKWSFFLKITDGHPCRLNVKGSSRYKLWNKIFITSNKHPNLWYPSKVENGVLHESFLRRIYELKLLTDTACFASRVGGNTIPPPRAIEQCSKLLTAIPVLLFDHKNGLQETIETLKKTWIPTQEELQEEDLQKKI